MSPCWRALPLRPLISSSAQHLPHYQLSSLLTSTCRFLFTHNAFYLAGLSGMFYQFLCLRSPQHLAQPNSQEMFKEYLSKKEVGVESGDENAICRCLQMCRETEGAVLVTTAGWKVDGNYWGRGRFQPLGTELAECKLPRQESALCLEAFRRRLDSPWQGHGGALDEVPVRGRAGDRGVSTAPFNHRGPPSRVTRSPDPLH